MALADNTIRVIMNKKELERLRSVNHLRGLYHREIKKLLDDVEILIERDRMTCKKCLRNWRKKR